MVGLAPMEKGRGGGRQQPRELLNWRLLRLCIAPVVVALLIAAFSLGSPPAPMTSSLAPNAFEGASAYAQLQRMNAVARGRLPGSRGDLRLLEYLERQLRGLGSTGSGGYALKIVPQSGQTAWGERGEPLLVARRAGSSSQSPIALIAARDSASRGDQAQLSGAAALLQLATILAQTETRHPVYVIFSSGGSGGGVASAQWLRSTLGERLDAAIVLSDLGGRALRRPFVQPFSTGLGGAQEVLTRTVSNALRSELGADPGTASLASQLAHLAFPLSVGEQGPLNGAGIPSVAVSLAGEHGADAGEPVSEPRLQAAGRGVLSAFYALDHGSEVARAQSTGLLLSGRLLPAWTVALLTLSLLVGPLVLACDALLRLRRHGHRGGRWLLLPLTCAAPFLACGVTLKALAAIGALPAPPNPVGASALGIGVGTAVAAILAATALALGWRLWRGLVPGIELQQVRRSGLAAVAVLAAACAFALLIWLIDPYAALLLLPALYIWPLAISPGHRPQDRLARLALVLVPALAPLALLIAYYMALLGLGPVHVLLEGIAMVGGGYVDWGGALLWSIALGLLAAIAIATFDREDEAPMPVRPRRTERARAPYPGERPVHRERTLKARDARVLR